jgi:hypothetical protein
VRRAWENGAAGPALCVEIPVWFRVVICVFKAGSVLVYNQVSTGLCNANVSIHNYSEFLV